MEKEKRESHCSPTAIANTAAAAAAASEAALSFVADQWPPAAAPLTV